MQNKAEAVVLVAEQVQPLCLAHRVLLGIRSTQAVDRHQNLSCIHRVLKRIRDTQAAYRWAYQRHPLQALSHPAPQDIWDTLVLVRLEATVVVMQTSATMCLVLVLVRMRVLVRMLVLVLLHHSKKGVAEAEAHEYQMGRKAFLMVMVHHPPHLKQQPVMSSDPVPHQSTLGSVQMLKAGARTMRPGFDCCLYGCAGVVPVC